VRTHCHRKLQFLDLSAAFGEFRSDFGLPPSLSSLIALTELRIKVRMAPVGRRTCIHSLLRHCITLPPCAAAPV
jgi:hypothetical protein